MLDFSTKLGRHVKRRLAHEKVIWLTTVDATMRLSQGRSVPLERQDFPDLQPER
jgi:signal recognition particle subunit SEC65